MKTSKHQGKIYFPKTIGASLILLQDDRTDLVLSRMFYIQSYCFLVLGWAESLSKLQMQLAIDAVSNELGFTLLDQSKKSVELNPSKSKLDYVTHKTIQVSLSPGQLRNFDSAKKAINKAEPIPISTLYRNQNNISKVVLITTRDPELAIVSLENVHPNLVTEKSIVEPTLVRENPRAHVYVSRKGSKTFVKILDGFELNNPFLNDDYGINQTWDNWELWKSAIEANNYYIYIANFDMSYNLKKLNIVTKIKVGKIEYNQN
jgi:hypothetical protein